MAKSKIAHNRVYNWVAGDFLRSLAKAERLRRRREERRIEKEIKASEETCYAKWGKPIPKPHDYYLVKPRIQD